MNNGQMPQDYDMWDDADEINSHFISIKDPLEFIHENLWKSYTDCDKKALQWQKLHRSLALLATLGGTLAILFAIVQLSGIIQEHWPIWVECIAAIIALLAVVSGLFWYFQKKWFLHRHKAESFRSFKFRSLVDPCLWCGSEDELQSRYNDWKYRICRETSRIKDMTLQSIHQCIKEENIFEEPCELDTCIFDETRLSTLVKYYRDKRIAVQRKYFDKQAGRYEKRDKWTRFLPTLLFFFSIVAVLVHFIIDIFIHSLHNFSVPLLFFAASLPVLSAGIRTYRSTYEFARSAAIYRAKQNALEHLDEKLEEEIQREKLNEKEILSLLWHCEEFLRAEHREWLRLMLEAEWFI